MRACVCVVQMDTFVNPLRSSVRNVGNIVRSMPDNFVDGVARVSGGFRSIPNNMLDGVGKMLNVKGVSIHTLASFCCAACRSGHTHTHAHLTALFPRLPG